MIKKVVKRNKGFVLLFAITLASMLLAMALGVSNIALKEINFSTSARNAADAFFAADTGAECMLFHDKVASGVFTSGSPASQNITCAGSSTINVVKSNPSLNNFSWDFVVPSLGSVNQSCVIVKVSKNFFDPNNVTTSITSKGYNVGNASCNSTNVNRTERELELTYVLGFSNTASPSPGPPPPTTYTVTPSAGSNGSINPSSQQTINSGSTTVFTVTPNPGYTTSVGGTCGGSLVGTTYTTNAITANCTVSATFSAFPIALDSVSDSTTRLATITWPVTWSHTIGSGSNRILAVTTASRQGTLPPSSVTYNGVSLTMVRSDIADGSLASIWYLINPPIGTYTVSVTMPAGNVFQGNGISLFNVNQASPVDANAGTTGTSVTPMSVNLTTNTANTWIIDVEIKRITETLTMTSMTNRVERENTSVASFTSGVSTVGPAVSAGSYLMHWTGTGSNPWAISAAAFKQ